MSMMEIWLFCYLRAECESQVKGFSGASFKKFKTEQEAKAFVGCQPAAKRQNFQRHQPKQSFSNAIAQFAKKQSAKGSEKVTQTGASSDEDDEAFQNLKEYGDDSKVSTKIQTRPTSSKLIPPQPKKPRTQKKDDPMAIKFKPPPPTKTKIYKGLKFNEDSEGFVHVYTDGSCENNGKRNAAAGLGVYFGEDHQLNVAEPVTGRPTNNAGEIQAAIRAIRDAQSHEVKRLNIFTDSQFVIKSVCTWIPNWKRKDWKLSTGKKVVNHKNFQELDALIEDGNMLIKWSYIRAHKGYDGNEKADELAKMGATKYRNKTEKVEKASGSDCDSDLWPHFPHLWIKSPELSLQNNVLHILLARFSAYLPSYGA